MSQCRINITPHTESMAEYPGLRCDIFCPTAGDTYGSFNYYSISCSERLKHDTCDDIECQRNNKYGVKPEPVEKKSVRKTNKDKLKHECACCGVVGVHQGRGLIKGCYDKHRGNKTLDNFSRVYRKAGATKTV